MYSRHRICVCRHVPTKGSLTPTSTRLLSASALALAAFTGTAVGARSGAPAPAPAPAIALPQVDVTAGAPKKKTVKAKAAAKKAAPAPSVAASAQSASARCGWRSRGGRQQAGPQSRRAGVDRKPSQHDAAGNAGERRDHSRRDDPGAQANKRQPGRYAERHRLYVIGFAGQRRYRPGDTRLQRPRLGDAALRRYTALRRRRAR